MTHGAGFGGREHIQAVVAVAAAAAADAVLRVKALLARGGQGEGKGDVRVDTRRALS